jgi:hypothetical protein
MVKITTHKNIKTKISKISETTVMTSSHYLLLVLSVAAIMITYTFFTSSINTAQAQTAKNESNKEVILLIPSEFTSRRINN